MAATQQELVNLTFGLQGMTCASCATKIQKGLGQVEGVREATVNLATEKATVLMEAGQADLRSLQQKVESLGYTVVISSVKLSLVGMTCANCAQKIERRLNSLSGVLEATVNFGTETALVKYVPGVIDVSRMKKAVAALGYEAFAKDAEGAGDAEREAREKEMKRQWHLFIFSAILTAPLLVYMFAELTGVPPGGSPTERIDGTCDETVKPRILLGR